MLVVTVWEAGLAPVMMSPPDAMGMTYLPPSAEAVATTDAVQHDHATATADAGAELARGLGATATPLPTPDSRDIADTVGAIAEQRDAAAIVVGSRGLGAVKSKLLGSTSQRLLHDARRPVLVVRTGTDHQHTEELAP